MKYFFIIILLGCTELYSQQSHTLSGYVKDKQSGEVLIGAVVADSTLKYATTTNGYGFYSLTIPSGKYVFFSAYLGYENKYIELSFDKNVVLNIELNPASLQLDQVTVTAEYKNNPNRQNEFNAERLNIQNIKQLPSIFGEVDVVKAVQTMSGVKTIGDGSSAMFIRGGSSDQNLILIDEAPVYNPSHLFGLVSVFNPDALNHVTIYKSNMPAQYGGRVSAVIDCKMKEGSSREYNFSTGLSTLSSIFTAEGPIIKEKASFLVSARKSWIDLAFNPGGMLDIVPGFYDINLKINAAINRSNRLFFSIYQGQDIMNSVDGFYNKWGNRTATLRWSSNIGPRLFSNISVVSSDYRNFLEFNEEGRSYSWLTGINDINFKGDFSFYINPDNLIKFGVGSIYHKFIPGESADSLQSIARIQSWEHSLYILNDMKVAKWLGINYGIRLSVFQNTGKAHWYLFNENHSAIGQSENQKGVYNTYWSPEPRLNVNFKINPDCSLKLSYSRNAQYMQILQNNSLSYTSLETWFPATTNIKPILTDSYSIGWFQNISKFYSLSVESYFKDVKNQIDFIDHARILNNSYVEAEVRNGTAYSFGIELAFKMEFDKLSSTLSYTYSRAFRQIEDVNDGQVYSAPFDIPHDIRLSGSYQFSGKWNFGFAWIFMTGRPVSLPIGFYYWSGDPIPIYSDRNSSRFPDYHRLDIAFSYSNKTEGKRSYREMSFGFFNAYARKNPIGYMFFPTGGMSTGVEVYQYTLFTIMPNFSVKFYF